MFYEILTTLCKKNDVKLTPLTKSLGISEGAIKGWKRGSSPTGETLLKFADYFGVSIDYLLTGKEPQAQHSERVNNMDTDLSKHICSLKGVMEFFLPFPGKDVKINYEETPQGHMYIKSVFIESEGHSIYSDQLFSPSGYTESTLSQEEREQEETKGRKETNIFEILEQLQEWDITREQVSKWIDGDVSNPPHPHVLSEMLTYLKFFRIKLRQNYKLYEKRIEDYKNAFNAVKNKTDGVA